MDGGAPTSERENTFFDADSYENNQSLELAWAEKAVGHMEIHYNLITSVPPKQLRLTAHDDEIYNSFITEFPDFKLDVLDTEQLKSEESKKKWRTYCERFRETVEDSSFGTLVRIDCSDEYKDENTILVLRIQFLAIEIARNRHGLNDGLKKSIDTVNC